jgi:hypothetical protein
MGKALDKYRELEIKLAQIRQASNDQETHEEDLTLDEMDDVWAKLTARELLIVRGREPTAIQQAHETLVLAIRKNHPNSKLSDDDLIAKYDTKNELKSLTEYFEKIQRDNAELDRKLIDID